MAKNNTTSGIYIKESSEFPLSVVQAETAVPVFIGPTEKADKQGTSLLQTPEKINSLAEYQLYFGGAANAGQHFCLYESIDLFFQNGGANCYIISTGSYINSICFADLNTGIENSKNISASILVIPDAVYLPVASDFYTLQQNMLQHCANLKTRFAILNTVEPSTNISDDTLQFRNGIGNTNLSWGAAYYPWVILINTKKIPPCGAIAGVYASTDNNHGVWKAPANFSLNGINGLTHTITKSEQENMNVHETGKSINAIRFFTGKGFLVWGARTLNGNDNEWRYVSVKRFFIMAEESVKNACMSFVFEPNDFNTWVKVQGMIENFLIFLWRQGALQGNKPEHAFYVAVGIGKTMTALDVLEGRMIVQIGMALVRPAEFNIINILINMQTS